MSRFRNLGTLFGASPEGRDATQAPVSKALLTVPNGIALFHITHWKAGSQWVRAVLEKSFGLQTVVAPQNNESQVLNEAIQPGKVYMCVYVCKQEFDTLEVPAGSRRVIFIRDLRDTLVSGYFSIRYSHPVDNPVMEKWRKVLTKLSQEEGLIYLMEVWLNLSAIIQRSWLEAGDRCFRLEDFMTNPAPQFLTLLKEGWDISVDPNQMQQIIEECSFEKMSGGRERGKENVKSHYRKGENGDWKNHFSPKVTARFKALYQDLLVKAGYETSADW